MSDETVYKRGEKGRKVSRSLKTRTAKLTFKNRSISITRLISIGRDPGNDVVLAGDPLVSRRHALIEKEGDRCFIMDKGSTNGTYVNNNPIPRAERVEIRSGDVITIGKTRLTLQ
ncbi:MAG: FHA domain-containing protein [Spirochaetota bacterium]